jgi:peptidoglycan/LPS O-acetylase OafA/YrhL
MPKKPHREAFEESNRHLRVRFSAAALSVATLVVAMQVTAAGESLEPGDLLMTLLMAAIGGGAAAVVALILGVASRWQSMPRRTCRAASLAVALAGALLVAFAIAATHAGEPNPLGMREERHTPAYLGGLLLVAFGLANRPPRANLG